MKQRVFDFDPAATNSDLVLAAAMRCAGNAGRKVQVVVRVPIKSRDQEEKYHAMVADIARQVPFHGKLRDADHFWKRLLVDAFKHDTKDDPELAAEWASVGGIETVPALNHDGFVILGEQTRKFTSKLAAAFIEWLHAYGAENGVRWSMPKWQERLLEVAA